MLTSTKAPTSIPTGTLVVNFWDDQGAQATGTYRQVALTLADADSQVGKSNVFTLSFAGFLPFETVQVSASDAVLFAPLTMLASSSGSVSNFSITTNAAAPSGVYSVTAKGVTSGTVVSGVYQVAGFSVRPVQAVAGQHPDVAIDGSGFIPNETVQLTSSLWTTFTVTADAHGLLQTDQVITANTAGRYTVSATGDSSVTGSAIFYPAGVTLSASQADAGTSGTLFVSGAAFGESEPVSLATD